MQFKRAFTVDVPIQKVVDFHRVPDSLKRLTPPPLRIVDLRSPEILQPGDRMSFRLKFGPFSIAWEALIDELSSEGFVDRQISGPFEEWVHRHGFRSISPEKTEIVDQIEYTFKRHLGWFLIGVAMRLGMPLLFAFRSMSTIQYLK